MKWTDVNLNEIRPGSAFVAETTNNTYVVLAEFLGTVQIVFESFKLSECITYSHAENLNITNDFNHESADFLKYADLIPFGHMDEIKDISENVYTWRVGLWGRFEVETRSYSIIFSDGARWLASGTDNIPAAIMHHFNGVNPWDTFRKSRKH